MYMVITHTVFIVALWNICYKTARSVGLLDVIWMFVLLTICYALTLDTLYNTQVLHTGPWYDILSDAFEINKAYSTSIDRLTHTQN